MATTAAPPQKSSRATAVVAIQGRLVEPPTSAEEVIVPWTGPHSFRWTREHYDRAVRAGVLVPEDRVELLNGELVQHMSQNSPHATAIQLVEEALRAAFGTSVCVRSQLPLALSDSSTPEPDAAVVSGSIREYADAHPTADAVRLLVEVSDATLAYDRGRKAEQYASAGIGDYWIVNVPERQLEVYRDPTGGTFGTKTTYAPGDAVAPLHAPEATIAISDLLP